MHHNETVYGRLWDGTNESKVYATVKVKDLEEPEVTVNPKGTTTNSVSVTVSATDGQSGMREDSRYTYSIKITGQDDSTYTMPSNAQNISSNTYTFTGLTQGTSYDVKVEVNGDNADNIGTGTLSNQSTGTVGGATGGLVTGSIIASSPTWSGGKASITLTTNTGLQIQYQVGSTTENWTTINSGGQVTGINHKDTVYARLWDGNNAGSEASVMIKDTIPPIINSFTATNVTYNSITVQVNASDTQTGLNGTYTYYLNDGNAVTSEKNSFTFSGLSDGVQYTLKVDVSDRAGHSTAKTIVINTQKKSEIEKAKDSGQKYNNNTELEDDYGNKVWIPGGFNVASDSGTSVSEGVVIEDEKDNQFVWIPVGTYKLSETQSKNNELVRRNFTASGFDTVSGDNVRYDDDGKYSYYGEGDSRSVAYGTIGNFKAKAAEKGGFYIGRFEQGQGNQSKINLTPYNNIRRNDAMDEAESMYYGNSYVTSELMSSYAWDTALNFVCQTNEEGYTLSITKDRTYGNIGTGVLSNTGTYKVNGSVVDKYSNIYDLIGNIREWTTEYSAYSGAPCTAIGGVYAYANKVSRRTCNGTAYAGSDQGFRIQLYLK